MTPDAAANQVKTALEEVFEVPPDVAIQMKILEYDKQITDAESNVAYLKHQRNMFIWDNNMQAIRNKYKKV